MEIPMANLTHHEMVYLQRYGHSPVAGTHTAAPEEAPAASYASPVYGPSVVTVHQQFVNVHVDDTMDSGSRGHRNLRQGPRNEIHSTRGANSAASKMNTFDEAELQHQRLEELSQLQNDMAAGMLPFPYSVEAYNSYFSQQYPPVQHPYYGAHANLGMGNMGLYTPAMGMGMGMGMMDPVSAYYMEHGMPMEYEPTPAPAVLPEQPTVTLPNVPTVAPVNSSITMNSSSMVQSTPAQTKAQHKAPSPGADPCPCIHCIAATNSKTPVRPVEPVQFTPEEFTPSSRQGDFETPIRPSERSEWYRSSEKPEARSERSRQRPADRTPVRETPRRGNTKGSSGKGDRYTESSSASLFHSKGSASGNRHAQEEQAAPIRLSAPQSITLAGHYGRKFPVKTLIQVQVGDYVVFDGDRGDDLAIVVALDGPNGKNMSKSNEDDQAPRRPRSMVQRKATADEVHYWTVTLQEEARDAVSTAGNVLSPFKLPMSLRCASYQFDHKKLTLYYDSEEERVDFRRVLTDLYNKFHCRIWFEKATDLPAFQSSA